MKLLSSIKAGLKVTKLFISKRSPEILVVSGIVLTTIATVVLCKETIETADILQDHADVLDDINNAIKCGDEITESEARALIKADEKKTIKKLVKCYYKGFLLFAGGTLCVLAGFGILKKRYALSITAYNALQSSYDIYRGRIKEKYGDEADEYGLYGTETVQTTVKDDSGKKVTQVNKYVNQDLSLSSPYARIFAPYDYQYHTGSKYYENDPVYNESMLRILENGFVARYESGEPIFLNEVYKALGFDILTDNGAGQRMGWWKGHEGPGADGYFSLRLTKVFNKPDPGYGEESEMVVWIVDPNVPTCLV